MELKRLTEEYCETAQRLHERLAKLRGELERADADEEVLLRRRIELLGAEVYDLRLVAAHLRGYHD